MRARLLSLLVCVIFVVSGVKAPAQGPFDFNFDVTTKRWSLSNGIIHAAFQVGTDGRFGLTQLDNAKGAVWSAPANTPSSPISFQFGSTTYDAATFYTLVDQYVQSPDAKTKRQVIVLTDLNHTVDVTLALEMYVGQAVLRHHVTITNIGVRQFSVQAANLLPYSFAAPLGASYQFFRVNQWSVGKTTADFQTSQVALNPNGAPQILSAGSGGTYCSWMAVEDNNSQGLFAGWEFDGLSLGSARHLSASGTLQLSAAISGIFHAIEPGASLTLPGGFLGTFAGNWDDAAFLTQRFVDPVLAKPAPEGFPYVGWDSWGYDANLNEDVLRRSADAAAAMGIELFVVDLGWARQIGDWRDDPAKFPGGLRALSDYVHSLGMKFGLHFALAEAMPASPVLQQNPDWTSSVSYNYAGASSLCLSNKPTREWLIQQAVAMIDNYNPDWILQDGQNMVKACTKRTHTHDFRDSNFSNAVDGINFVVSEVQRQRPNVIWENCEDGGSMMTFNMVQNYVTSITNDASGALGSRKGVYGATYPFSPRYADRYMPEEPTSSYVTRSYMFGGPWHFMERLADIDLSTRDFAKKEIEIYKRIRSHINDGQVFHITNVPATGRVDALESYVPSTDKAITIVTRDGTAQATATVKLQGLRPTGHYIVRFEDDTRVLTMTGAQLMGSGVPVNLPASQSAEIVYVHPFDH